MLDDFRAAGSEVLIIAPGEVKQSEKYANAMGFNGVVIPDKKKDIYRKYGLNRSWLGMVQKSEMFVIDGAGKIRFSQGHGLPWSLPSVSEVLDVVKGLQVDPKAN
ncbi:redoxin domain-containing protein [Dehalococcoides mccartyi]|nr:redoxin domain-containing protein [Dehalococcoides mccartyi]